MCQYKNMCKNFKASETNPSSCAMLCVRNPLLNYEITDLFVTTKRNRVEADVEFTQPDRILKAPLHDLMEEMEQINNDPKMTMGQRRDKINTMQMQNEVNRLQDIEPIENLYDAKEGDYPKTETQDKSKKEEDEIAQVVKDNTLTNQAPAGNWSVPKRRRSRKF